MSIPHQELTLAADFKEVLRTNVLPATAQGSGAQLVWGQGKSQRVGVCKARETDFPGGPMVRIPCFHCRLMWFSPGWGVKIPPATQCSQKKKKKKKRPGRILLIEEMIAVMQPASYREGSGPPCQPPPSPPPASPGWERGCEEGTLVTSSRTEFQESVKC